MKNLIVILVVLAAVSLQSCAKNSGSEKVPQLVLSAFESKFPDVKKAAWEKEDETEWEAEFKWNAKEYSANFSTEGKWIETEYQIKESEIPANIRAILDQNFSEYEIEEPEIAETLSGKSYEMEIEIDEVEFQVAIDSKGNLTKKTESKENNENDED